MKLKLLRCDAGMAKLKEIDYKILSELMANAKVSDRQLARKLGVSQPTVSRRRVKLERELINGYTVFPKWGELGYTILAVTLVKIKTAIATKDRYMAVRERAREWLKNHPNVILASGCRGSGVDSIMISLHRNYGDYDTFMRNQRLELGDLLENVQSSIVNLAGDEVIRPLHLKYLAEHTPP